MGSSPSGDKMTEIWSSALNHLLVWNMVKNMSKEVEIFKFLLISNSKSDISLFFNSMIQTSLEILINLYINYIRCLPFSSEEIIILAINNFSFPKGYYLSQSETPNKFSSDVRNRVLLDMFYLDSWDALSLLKLLFSISLSWISLCKHYHERKSQNSMV